jgi:hypothetical protein
MDKPIDIQSQKQRLEDLLCLIDAFPGESQAGLWRDDLQRKKLEAELQQLKAWVNALAELSSAKDALNRLIDALKRP